MAVLFAHGPLTGGLNKLGIDAVQRHQFIMGSALGNAALVQNDDLIGLAHGGKPVRVLAKNPSDRDCRCA